MNEDDLAADRRPYGFDDLDFRFDKRRLDDALAPSGVGCAALVELPSYEVPHIRTGQSHLRRAQLWEREFEVVRKMP